MEYKLLRALSIFLQAGLVILLVLLLSLILFSCKQTPSNKAVVRLNAETQREIMEQRFLNEVRQYRQNFKVLCFEKKLSNTHQAMLKKAS